MIYHGHDYQLDDLPGTVIESTDRLAKYVGYFDFIVVTGMSGVLVGVPVALNLGVPVAVLRKQGEPCHGGFDVLNYKAVVGRYLFLDDFISVGRTYKRVRDRMADWPNDHHGYDEMPQTPPTYAGAYLYENQEFSWAGDGGWTDGLYSELKVIA